jgi:hypothetical protein
MLAVAAVEAIRVLRYDSSRSERAQKINFAVSVPLSALIWFFGGIISIGLMISGSDCGTGAAAPCLDHPGLILSLLTVVCMISPTPLLGIVFWLGRRSEVYALLAPPFIAGLYLLGIHLQLPHAGFGDSTN